MFIVNRLRTDSARLFSSTLPSFSLQSFPRQEMGFKQARPLGYTFNVDDHIYATDSGSKLALSLANDGTAGVCLYVYDYLPPPEKQPVPAPRKYTIEAGKNILAADWPLPASAANASDPFSGSVNLSLHGPNGFVRRYSGAHSALGAASSVTLKQIASNGSVILHVLATPPADPQCAVDFRVLDNAYSAGGPWTFSLTPSQTHATLPFNLTNSGSWYDLTVEATSTCVAGGVFTRQLMGHVETGRISITDPAMGRDQQQEHRAHPDTPASLRSFDKSVPAPLERQRGEEVTANSDVNKVCIDNKDACDLQ